MVTCSRCVMDTTDPKIVFDRSGVCGYCHFYDDVVAPFLQEISSNKKPLFDRIEKLKKERAHLQYDCLLGISGGLDSSYLAVLVKEELGLRPLLFNVETGWSSKESTNNIVRIAESLDLDLYTEVINWSEMADLQRSFLKSGVPHLDVPQDHAIASATYKYAISNGYTAIINGGNMSTEWLREPLEWAYHASDVRHILDIQKTYGTIPLKDFPLCDILDYQIKYRFVNGMRIIRPLDYFEYDKQKISDMLSSRFGWMPYTHKHFESRFTRFFEGYFLIERYGYDKRKAHFSSLILSGQMTRQEALEQLYKFPLDSDQIREETDYICRKLDISPTVMNSYLLSPKKSYRDFSNKKLLIDFMIKISTLVGENKKMIQ